MYVKYTLEDMRAARIAHSMAHLARREGALPSEVAVKLNIDPEVVRRGLEILAVADVRYGPRQMDQAETPEMFEGRISPIQIERAGDLGGGPAYQQVALVARYQ